jgi:hypothetical protein
MVDKILAWIFSGIRFRSVAPPNPYRLILTADSMTLHSSPSNTYAAFIFCLPPMIKGIASARLKGFWLGFLQNSFSVSRPTKTASVHVGLQIP